VAEENLFFAAYSEIKGSKIDQTYQARCKNKTNFGLICWSNLYKGRETIRYPLLS